ncbi:MAG: glycoside hydrolase [Firmicutes bacterium]|nr:glycoside hydrolase [Bacillota bacterium]
MKIHLVFVLFFVTHFSLFSQIRLKGYAEACISPELMHGRWDARWVSCPDEPENVYGIYHFRKNFEIKDIPAEFIVHVSADNRYKLYINGHLISLGPARGDIYNWNFETVNLALFLKTGKNILSAVVWNYAEKKPVAQISFNQTGFLLQGNTETEKMVNTDHTWLCLKNDSYTLWEKPVLGYYVAGPGESTNASFYPWGWEKPDFDDSTWKNVRVGMEAGMKGARDYPGRLLVPSPIPPMEMKQERMATVRMATGITCPEDFPKRSTPLLIPANSNVKLLIDNQQLTTGYFSLLFSQRKNAEIRIGYAEALYEEEKQTETVKSYHLNNKGHRDEVVGKRLVGYEDKIIADGGEGRIFTTLWWRTWRYIELHMTTGEEPLRLDDIYGTFSAYPFQPEFSFYVPGYEELHRMLDIGWLTARLCANETYMDCPYYEQLQYFGDTRIRAMITMYNTRDKYMVKNAIEQGRQSIVADGITMSRYPSSLHQFISSFSLWWICMGYDYWMMRGDKEYIQSLLPAYRGILAWYEQWLKPDHSLGYVPHWFFADWAQGFPNGEPIREEDGNSAFQDLVYILTLEAVAEIEQEIGSVAIGEHYSQVASDIKKTIRTKYWNESRGVFSDTHDHRSFSQHVNALAVLAGVVSGQEAVSVMEKTLTDKELIQATIYFRYYVHQALQKAGLGDLFLDNLQIWRDQMELGLTTWAEMPKPSRSDCHAWGSSPNIEFFRIILGIQSDAPGFSKVRISPSLGNLKQVSGSIPHPSGSITAEYTVEKSGTLKARICLPDTITGVFSWKEKEYVLNPGEQVIEIQ